MRKSIVVLFATLALSQTAIAGSGPDIYRMDGGLDGGGGAESSDVYTQLQVMFNSAALPTIADLTGWYSGRCYLYTSPSTPRADILVGDTTQTGADNGPLFPPSTIFKAVSVAGDESAPANTFDVLNKDLNDQIMSSYKSNSNLLTEVREDSGSLITTMPNADIVFRYRKGSNGYLFAQIMSNSQQNTMRGSMCYYFKKVK